LEILCENNEIQSTSVKYLEKIENIFVYRFDFHKYCRTEMKRYYIAWIWVLQNRKGQMKVQQNLLLRHLFHISCVWHCVWRLCYAVRCIHSFYSLWFIFYSHPFSFQQTLILNFIFRSSHFQKFIISSQYFFSANCEMKILFCDDFFSFLGFSCSDFLSFFLLHSFYHLFDHKQSTHNTHTQHTHNAAMLQCTGTRKWLQCGVV
jgi:hypothetical protein